MNSRTVFIGLSGASLPAFGALMQDGAMPFLKAWMSSGVRGGIDFLQPWSSVAAWTTLATGQSPARHGAFDIFRRQTPQGQQLRALTSRDLTSEPVWIHANREGRHSTVVDYPLTFPPPRIEGNVISGSWATARQIKLGCHPSDLGKRLALEGFALEGFAMEWPVAAQTERLDRIFGALEYFMAEGASDLTILLVRGFETVLDAYRDKPDLKDACVAYFASLDRHLSRVAQAAENMMLVSAPGGEMEDNAALANDWLAEHGYLAWVGDAAPGPLERKVIDTDQLNKQAKLIDWTLTRAYAPLAGNGEIHMLGSDDNLAAKLAAAPWVKRVWQRDELYAGPHEDLAPDLALQTDRSMTEGVFAAAGPLFRKGAGVPNLPAVDIAPLLLYSVGIPIPGDMDGQVPLAAIDSEWLAANPIQFGAGAAERRPEGRVLDPEAEAIVLKRLQDLGYLE